MQFATSIRIQKSLIIFMAWLGWIAVAEPTFGERMTAEKLLDLARIGDAAISPDGSQIAYLTTSVDLEEDSSTVSLWIQPLLTETGQTQAVGFGTPLIPNQPKALLEGIKGLNSLSWIRRPEGDRLLYIAPGEGEEAKPQAWLMNPADPQSAKQITSLEQGIANLKPSPAGNAIAFSVNIKLDPTVNEVYPDLPKADARIIDSLMYRHWNAWHDFTYSHLHVAELSAEGVAGEAIDLMPNLRFHCPMPPFGGSEQFDFSPDGSEIAFTMKQDPNPAESTDSGVYLVSSKGGEPRHITAMMPGYDMEPRYSPDGKLIAFHSMERAGFEADRNRIMVYDRSSGQTREVTVGLDQTTHGATWSPDGSQLFFTSETRGTKQLFRINLDGTGLSQISSGNFDFAGVRLTEDGRRMLLKQQNMLRPTELALIDVSTGQIATITDINGAIYADLELPKVEQRYVTATDGKKIHCWVVLPPDFDSNESQTWPMLTYCQGGPQGQIGQWFSYRWNFHLMAANGYVVLAPNRRGLPGFGRQWNDQISGDWGGQAMQDLLSATDAMLENPRIDRERVAAVGASFGGYTVFWMMGNAQDRFCAMIAHCGVFNLESMYGSTEELFFVNWDLGGPYWTSQGIQHRYDQFSPHRYVGNWKTPLLVIHGEKDFRVPITQGMEAFTAAQVQRVPSRFLYFPEEGHWVLKPQNSVVWTRVFFEWLDRFCKPSDQQK
jgi:dipeptidyl aminopeptidase/acylaminoacyl peptidase